MNFSNKDAEDAIRRETVAAKIVSGAHPLPKVKPCGIVSFLANQIVKMADREEGLFGKSNYALLTSDAYLLKRQTYEEVSGVLYYKGKEIYDLDLYTLSSDAEFIANQIVASLKKFVVPKQLLKANEVIDILKTQNQVDVYNVINVLKAQVTPAGIDNYIVEYRGTTAAIIPGSTQESIEHLTNVIKYLSSHYILGLGIDASIH